MRKGPIVLAIVALVAAVTALSPPLVAYNGGVGDDNLEYGCSTKCHTIESASTITMVASDNSLAPGDPVTVTVTVSGAEASGTPLGVMILSALTDTNSLPSDAGWTIVSDPTGSTTYNYHEVPSYSGSVTMTWTLSAPTSPGVYLLYAREIHGDGETYSHDFSTGLAFAVGGPVTPGLLEVIVSSPASGSKVSGTITVTANMIPAENISYAVLRIDGEVVGNLTSAPFEWSVDTTEYTDDTHVLNITATNITSGHGYKEITITVDNAAENEKFLEWVWTMAAGSILIVSMTSVMIVLALMIRRRIMGKVK